MRLVIVLLAFFISSNLPAQDVSFGKQIVDTLTSPYFWGRGYTNDGMEKAAAYIAGEFKRYAVKPMSGKSYFQAFSYPVNIFPGKMELSINGKNLLPGKDFIVDPAATGIRKSGSLTPKDSVSFINQEDRFIVRLQDKLTWSVSQDAADYSMVHIDKKAITGLPENYVANIESKFIRKFSASNICGLVPGKRKPDSVILITAHYDHLGGMGAETFFPGANDNASGVSLLMNLARYYAVNQPDYSIGFICFAGEEAGLVGSQFFTEKPLIPLKQVRFLVNTDLAGTGEEGITVVNATEFPAEFALMNAVNDELKLLVNIKPRGKAANSDHYFFTEKGVPAFFFYTMGGIKAYHDIYDRPETLPLHEHEDLFTLLINFNKKLMGN